MFLAPAPPPAPLSYQLTLTLSDNTANQLQQAGNKLYGLLATETAATTALPLVWYCTAGYGQTTYIPWTSAYQLYTSTGQLTVGKPVGVGFAADVEPGQLLTVQAGGMGEVSTQGLPNLLTAFNATTQSVVLGPAVRPDNQQPALPTCAVPLSGRWGQSLLPKPQLLLLFSPVPVAVGCAVRRWPGSASQGLLVDFTTATQRSVAFDINSGWSWGTGTWATIVEFGADLQPLLLKKALAFYRLPAADAQRSPANPEFTLFTNLAATLPMNPIPIPTPADGPYTKVKVVPIQGQGSLSGGTGTMSAGVFSCGNFDKNDLPVVGHYYNITGSGGLDLPGWVCVASGPTSQFRAKK